MSEKRSVLQHILKSILIAFIIAVVYFIVGNALLKGAYAELFHFLVSIGLFIGSIVIYFCILYFKSIKKLRWFFGAIAAYLFIVALVNSDIDIYFTNLFNSSHIPEKYSQYQDIANPVLKFKNKEMRLIVEGGTNLSPYLTKQNNLIVTKIREGYDRVGMIPKKEFYKLDNYGNLVAKYQPSNDAEIFFEGYFINVDEGYYKSWAFDGDTLKRKIEIHNKDFSFEIDKQMDFIKGIEEKAKYLFGINYYEDSDGAYKVFEKVVYWQDNTWHIFFNDTKAFRAIQSRVSEELFRYYSEDKYEWLPNMSPNIQYQYFQKEKLDNDRLWQGYLYTTIIVDQDTLKIKEALLMDDKWIGSDVKINNKNIGRLFRVEQFEFIPYSYYSNSKLHYKLFTNHLGKLYIIKKT